MHVSVDVIRDGVQYKSIPVTIITIHVTRDMITILLDTPPYSEYIRGTDGQVHMVHDVQAEWSGGFGIWAE